jgi:hypothetical protein
MNLDSLLGLTLNDARASLDSVQIVVIESAPPFHPRGYTPFWGEPRVVRARAFENSLELLVARELVGEERAGKSPAAR